MKNPVWLAELHRQWLSARGRSLGTKSRAFSRDWNKLLDAAGVVKAEDVGTAAREALKLENEGRLILERHRYRTHNIESVRIPLDSECWLRELFQTAKPEDVLDASLACIRAAAARQHSLHEERWTEWCGTIEAAFSEGRNIRPFQWRSPESVKEVMDLTFALTNRIWAGGLIREVSYQVGTDTKWLEPRKRIAERALSSFFGRETPLEAIGIELSESRVQVAGILHLYFDDGRSERISELKACYHLGVDLDCATGLSTPAKRVLMVENSKTTLRRLASLNDHGETLMVACSFPTRGIRRLLELLPPELPLYHFGDTDPVGFDILSKIRGAAGRPVIPFFMHRRVRPVPMPLTRYDASVLPRLLLDPLLEDVRPMLMEILQSGDKGDFEQETLGVPDRAEWPFYGGFPL